MEQHDEQHLDDVGYQVAVPEQSRHEHGDDPKHGDDGQRKGEGDEQRHLVVAVELIDNQNSVNITERNEAECEKAQRTV